MAEPVTLIVRRFDPSVDAAPYYQEFQIPWIDDGATDFMSLLQCLTYVYENCDQIAFDQNCGNGWCGRCALMVNGRPQLACWTRIESGGTYTVEPLAGLPVIRDLVVDKTVNYDKFVETDVAVQSSTPMDTVADIDYDFYWNTLQKFNTCRECMQCYAACPKVSQGLTDKFVGPGAMMQIAMRHLDPKDEADRVWQATFSGVFECDLCGECASVCPSMIDIVGMMKSLQDAAAERGLAGTQAVVPSSMAAFADAIAAAKDARA